MDEKKYVIHGYKHDGTLYKIWDEAILLEETDDYYVFGNSGTKVRKNYGSSWTTRETAILFYYKKNWFNIVAQLKRNGIHYYCNIASPAIIEDDAIKFIDYDLDLRIYPDGKYKILDRDEFEVNRRVMHYSKDLAHILNTKLKELIENYKAKEFPFSKETIKNYEKIYNEIINEKK